MRFGRYIVGLPSQDNDTLFASRPLEIVPAAEKDEDVNGAESSEADAIV